MNSNKRYFHSKKFHLLIWAPLFTCLFMMLLNLALFMGDPDSTRSRLLSDVYGAMLLPFLFVGFALHEIRKELIRNAKEKA